MARFWGAIVVLVITGCTGRKRKAVPCAQQISTLTPAPLRELATEWIERLSQAPHRFEAASVYAGRAFRETTIAARSVGARLLVVSAGLGLIDATDEIPPYALTIVSGAPDSIAERITESFSATLWWRSLQQLSPFARSLHEVAERDGGSILIALSGVYLSMITSDLETLPVGTLQRVRLFTRTPKARIEPSLRPFVMPYDDRLDGVDSSIKGTRNDFAARALRHFVNLGLSGTVDDDSLSVVRALSGWRPPIAIARARHSDAALLDLIRLHRTGAGCSTSKLLRFFRDTLGISCEQSRFAMLVRQVRSEFG